jgi:excisionase family DNA binding protein
LTVAQAAEFCKVKEATIRNWASLKKIPAHRANGSLFFLVDELIEWSSKR